VLEPLLFAPFARRLFFARGRPNPRALSILARNGYAARMDESTRVQVEAAAFRRLLEHFRSHTEVQNVDVMNLAGFCRNCLAKWYRAEAEARGVALSDEAAREVVYGMPYADWKARHQTPAKPR
jgi:hypothetical protein